jgi:hypothetical protein
VSGFLKTDRVRLPPRPGNIRELQNVIKRGVIKTAGTVLGTKTTEHIKPESGTTTEPIKTLADAERGPSRRCFGKPIGLSADRTERQSNRPFVGVPGAASDVPPYAPEETCDYSNSSAVNWRVSS